MKNKVFKQTLMLLALIAIMLIPYFVFAQTTGTIDATASSNPMNLLQKVGQGSFADANEDSLASIIGLVVNTALSLLGVIFVVLMVLAGYNWMTASGNEQKVDEAKSTIKRAIIGLVIVLGSWAIWTFILDRFISRL